MARNDMDSEIAALARITIEEVTNEDLLDYFGYETEVTRAETEIPVYETDMDIPF